jgi:hypothetical protein
MVDRQAIRNDYLAEVDIPRYKFALKILGICENTQGS